MSLPAAPRIPDWRHWPGATLAALTLIAILVYPAAKGSEVAYLAMVPVLLGLFLFDGRALAVAFSGRGVQLFVLAFVLLGISFAVTAQETRDVLAAFDFLLFPMTGLGIALFIRYAKPGNGHLVSSLALLGAALAVAVGAYQVWVLGIPRAPGGINAILYAHLGVFLGFIALGGLLLPGRQWRWLYLLGPVFGLICGELGQTRGAILVAVVLAAVFLLVAWRSGRLRRMAGPLLAVAGLALAAGIAAVALDASRAFSGFQTIIQLLTTGAADESTNIRLDIYRAGLRAFSESPFFGYGWYRRVSAAMPYMTEGLTLGLWESSSHLHNDVLNFGVGAGLVGVAAYACAIAAPLVMVWRSPADSQRTYRIYGALVVSVGFAAMGLTDVMFVFELPKAVFCLTAAIVAGFCLDAPPARLAS